MGGIGTYIAVKGAVNAGTELMLHPPKYPWWHRGWFTEIDKKRYSIIKITQLVFRRYFKIVSALSQRTNEKVPDSKYLCYQSKNFFYLKSRYLQN